MTGVIHNNQSKLYSIYANPEHVHMMVSRSPKLSEEILATIIADSTARFMNENKLSLHHFAWQESASAFFSLKIRCGQGLQVYTQPA